MGLGGPSFCPFRMAVSLAPSLIMISFYLRATIKFCIVLVSQFSRYKSYFHSTFARIFHRRFSSTVSLGSLIT